jgi:transcription initiation factor IIF auxiliary subunit
LHKSFPQPVRTVKDRSTNFRLEASGWGTFRIYANVLDDDGGTYKLSHDLVLEYPDGSETTA